MPDRRTVLRSGLAAAALGAVGAATGCTARQVPMAALQFLMAQGQRIRVIFANSTTMYHPMHTSTGTPSRPARPGRAWTP